MKLQNMARIGVPSRTLQLEYPKQHYLSFSSVTSPNEPLITKLKAKIADIVKRKLRLGDKIFRLDGVEKTFKHHFSVKEGEKLLKTSKCYISTTAGPILGFLFISTHKVAFCSEKSITYSSTSKDVSIHYKVVIPIGKLSKANENQNVKRPSEKYIEIVTVDNFDFWFLGFRSHQKTLAYLQQSIFQVL